MIDTVLARTEIPEWQLALRLLLAVALGALIGWERETKNRPAGLRTHILVCLAASAFTIVALELSYWARANDAPADPIRAIEAVTAGVAFLAAGTIIQARGHVVGLTTGAGLWLAGAIGVACGTGMFSIAVIVAVLAFIVLAWLQRLSERINPEAPKD
jgi:putative Mg2+ transporter-C (MgtC) family protein